MENYDKLIAEYSADYCHFLEAAYGKGMMSEGGAEAIEQMFIDYDLSGKTLLDVGCGLGGVVFYLAERYDVTVTGLELNPWMVEEATRRIPADLKHKVNFVTYQDAPHTSFADEQFDIVFSKGVLTHVNDKLPLFNELYRILKTSGSLLIDDWLSPQLGHWGPRIQKMCDMEDLTLYAQTEEAYVNLLKEAGFSHVAMFNRNSEYNRYNQHITDTLSKAENRENFIQQFDEKSLEEAIEAYQIIADAIKENELLIRAFQARK